MDKTVYKNWHIKERYDRINLVIPKGEKDRICYIIEKGKPEKRLPLTIAN